jgi:hypothetical protein
MGLVLLKLVVSIVLGAEGFFCVLVIGHLIQHRTTVVALVLAVAAWVAVAGVIFVLGDREPRSSSNGPTAA